MVLFIVLTMCCRNREQSRLSICAFPLVSDKGRSVQSLHGSPGSQLTSGELEGSFSQEKWFCCEAEPCRYGGKQSFDLLLIVHKYSLNSFQTFHPVV